VEGSFEHNSKLSGSIKCWEITDWLSERRLLKKRSAPWSLLIFGDAENYVTPYYVVGITEFLDCLSCGIL
jgi:hypothetical protein